MYIESWTSFFGWSVNAGHDCFGESLWFFWPCCQCRSWLLWWITVIFWLVCQCRWWLLWWITGYLFSFLHLAKLFIQINNKSIIHFQNRLVVQIDLSGFSIFWLVFMQIFMLIQLHLRLSDFILFIHFFPWKPLCNGPHSTYCMICRRMHQKVTLLFLLKIRHTFLKLIRAYGLLAFLHRHTYTHIFITLLILFSHTACQKSKLKAWLHLYLGSIPLYMLWLHFPLSLETTQRIDFNCLHLRLK